MTMQIDCGKGISIEVATDKLPQAAMAHVAKIGLRNLLQDSHAGEKDVAKAKEKVEKKLAALMRGEIRAATAFRTANPTEKVQLIRAIAEVWETRLEDLTKVKASKRDTEARRLARELLAKRAQEPKGKPKSKAA
jgi:hypothetical protein